MNDWDMFNTRGVYQAFEFIAEHEGKSQKELLAFFTERYADKIPQDNFMEALSILFNAVV